MWNRDSLPEINIALLFKDWVDFGFSGHCNIRDTVYAFKYTRQNSCVMLLNAKEGEQKFGQQDILPEENKEFS